MRLAYVAAGAAVMASVSESRSIPSSPQRSPSKPAKRQAFPDIVPLQYKNAVTPLASQAQASLPGVLPGVSQLDPLLEAYKASILRGEVEMLSNPTAYLPAGMQREVEAPAGLGTISGLYGTADSAAMQSPLAPVASNLPQHPNLTPAGVLDTLGQANNGMMIGAIHTSAGQAPPSFQPSNSAPLVPDSMIPAPVPSPVRGLVSSVYNPFGPGDVNVTTVPAKSKGPSNRGFQTGAGGDNSMVTGGVHAPNGTVIPTANVGSTNPAGGALNVTEGSKGVIIQGLSGNDTSHTQVNPTADAASYTASQ